LKKTILLVGGARSGKSQLALDLARNSGKKVLFVATASAGDEEMRQRIEKHRQERPLTWGTLESQCHIGAAIENATSDAGVIVVDCITLLVNNLMAFCAEGEAQQAEGDAVQKKVADEIDGLLACMRKIEATFIIVSNEVGLGLVPANCLGRQYRDALGRANQVLARHADEVYFLVAGIPMKVK
jgi:adenosylcobinamide kinase / adenosylcobinamide-phosphate guanylyltransferase